MNSELIKIAHVLTVTIDIVFFDTDLKSVYYVFMHSGAFLNTINKSACIKHVSNRSVANMDY